MVAHNAIAAQTHAETGKSLSDDPLKSTEVAILPEYTQFAVSAIKDMVDEGTFCYAFLPWHNRIVN